MLGFFCPKILQPKPLSSSTFRDSKPSGLDCSSVEDHRRLSGKGSLPPLYPTLIMLPSTDLFTRYIWRPKQYEYLLLGTVFFGNMGCSLSKQTFDVSLIFWGSCSPFELPREFQFFHVWKYFTRWLNHNPNLTLGLVMFAIKICSKSKRKCFRPSAQPLKSSFYHFISAKILFVNERMTGMFFSFGEEKFPLWIIGKKRVFGQFLFFPRTFYRTQVRS